MLHNMHVEQIMPRPKKQDHERSGSTLGFRPTPDVLAILRKLESMNLQKSKLINECIRLKWKQALGKRIASMP